MNFTGLDAIGNTMAAISKRQQITSNNVANAHTPDYMAKEASFADLLGNANNPFETKLSQKMGTSMSDANSTGAPVQLQKELIDMQENYLYYSVVTRRAAVIFNTLRTASQIGR